MNEGLCAGGPIDGKVYAAKGERLNIPINGFAGFGVGTYRFVRSIRMWVWQGTGKESEHADNSPVN